ncbi:hypothetical protein [Stenotrophomonas sp. PS02289]|uniref:hypothetical protein n=1 Tax=Stenotrophomonas sp. PS02289 TaxID=2991422 RepID=UPI00249A0510|nr:hypothetical protein [Stenotrophomonas sp. PS02289]
MHTSKGWQLRQTLLLALTAIATTACAPEPARTAAEAQTVDGVSLSEWTARWWRWADTQEIPPYLDPDGQLCHLGQSGPVWFLAGTDGQFEPRRECEVPEGKHVLLPVINMISYGIDGDESCRYLQRGAAMNNDHLVSAVVLLDGKPLPDVRKRRVSSDGCFRMDPDDKSSMLAAADGYWILLDPLPRGRHTLSVGAKYDTRQGGDYSGMEQSFEYVLYVGGKGYMALDEEDASMQQGRSAP